jgi:nitrite reductase/ring-hydroxylating ferredoxin subunit
MADGQNTKTMMVQAVDANAPARRGFYQVRSADDLGLTHLHTRVVAAILTAVAETKGQAAADHLAIHGLGELHQVIQAGDIGQIRDSVLESLRHDLLRMAVLVGRDVMGWAHDFHVDDYLILRINLPFEVARNAPHEAENPGIGRVTPSVRALAASRRVKDPIYDPKGYHRGYPPAAWAHGPHLDSWSGHSRDGINIWWAICDVPGEAGMVLYPELDPDRLAQDRRTLYLAAGQPLPPPTFAPLGAGDMLIFDPEILHGTHLNVTDQTRVAVSLRLNAGAPTFDRESFYAREFWRKASGVEAGDLEGVIHTRREDNLAPPKPPVTASPSTAPAVVVAAEGPGPHDIGPSGLAPEGGRLLVTLADRRLMVLRRDGRLHATAANCPHYGVDLVDGGDRSGCIHCPACAVAFDLTTGRSACASLSLATYPVADIDGRIILDPSEAAAG